MPKSKVRKKRAMTKRQKSDEKRITRRLHDMALTLELLDNEEQRLLQEHMEKEGAVDPRPCKGQNSNVCVAEGCYNEACLDDIPEEN